MVVLVLRLIKVVGVSNEDEERLVKNEGGGTVKTRRKIVINRKVNSP